jgi:hypothetical protein
MATLSIWRLSIANNRLVSALVNYLPESRTSSQQDNLLPVPRFISSGAPSRTQNLKLNLICDQSTALKWRGELRSPGIGHPGQPTCLHARCHSRARSGAARIPRSSRVRTGRGFDSRGVAIKTKSPPARGELFVLLVETAGIEPASASPLQIVLHT